MAQDDPKTAPKRLQGGSRGPNVGSKRVPRALQEAPRGSPRGSQEVTPKQPGSKIPLGPLRDLPGPLQGAILEHKCPAQRAQACFKISFQVGREALLGETLWVQTLWGGTLWVQGYV